MTRITRDSTLFVTAALIADLSPVLGELGFVHTGVPRMSQFSHPMIEWFVEFPPTQSVMDRLAAAIAWNALREWFSNEGESADEYERFRSLVGAKQSA